MAHSAGRHNAVWKCYHSLRAVYQHGSQLVQTSTGVPASLRLSPGIRTALNTASRRYLLSERRHTIGAARMNVTHNSKVTEIGPVPQNYDYFLVLDFEATCDDRHNPSPQEIIEFPVLKVNARTRRVDSVFHHYVLPQYHPELTPFCTQLTGIIQDMVNNQPHLPEVLQNFNQWMLGEGLLESSCKSIFVTCGDWDLKTMLPQQCAVLQVVPHLYFTKWINIKKSFADVTGTFPKSMMYMLSHLGLKHIGRHHSGIDDCHNIANILRALMEKDYILKDNGRL